MSLNEVELNQTTFCNTKGESGTVSPISHLTQVLWIAALLANLKDDKSVKS